MQIRGQDASGYCQIMRPCIKQTYVIANAIPLVEDMHVGIDERNSNSLSHAG